MPITFEQFRNRIRGFFGASEDSTTKAVDSFVRRMTRLNVTFVPPADATTSSNALTKVAYQAQRDGKLVSARFAATESVTVSVSDYFFMQLIKYKAPSYSVAYTMGVLDSRTANYTPNTKKQSHIFTLEATSANLEFTSADVIYYKQDKVLLGALVPPGGCVTLEIE